MGRRQGELRSYFLPLSWKKENVLNSPDAERRLDADPVDKVWRDGHRLVMHATKAVLPKRCVVCNAPTDGTLTRVRVRDTIPLLLFLITGPIVFTVVPRARLELGLCNHHRSRERLYQRVFTVMFVPAMLAFVTAVPGLVGAIDSRSIWAAVGAIGLILCVFLLAAATIFALVRPRLVTGARIDKPFVWLDCVHPDYLAECPELPRQG